MQVNKFAGEIARPDAVQKTTPAAPAATPERTAPDGPRRGDGVEISDAGRALAGASAESAPSSSTLDAKRVDDIRSKILSGAYNSLSVAHSVAQSILRSGDLDSGV